jgi:four helix bundle protein
MAETQDIVERTFDFSVRIIKLAQFMSKDSACNKILARQILRAGTSIGANIEEAKGGQSRADFIHKYSIALKEARETNYWLRLLAATEIINEKKLHDLVIESEELKNIIAKIIINSRKGNKTTEE